MKKRIAVYAGSFDPITNGHMDVIERVARLYDELVVMVAVDIRKTYTFSAEERASLIRSAVGHLENVTVASCVNGYVVDCAEKLGATVVVRGIRNFTDLESEQVIAEENRAICPGIETVFLPCRPELTHVSSSMVKGHVGAAPSWAKQVARSVPAAVVVALKEKWILKKAQAHWQKLMRALGNPAESNGVFEKLVAWYAEPHRGYHTLEHVVKMLDGLEEFGRVDRFCGYGADNDAVALAIWFHDVVYDPRAKDNEEQSATLAKDAATHVLGLAEDLGEKVAKLIIATKHAIDLPLDTDAWLLMDLDLAILGAPEDEFDAYEVGIRKEYVHVPARDFAIGRAKILQSFLDRASVYMLQCFREKYEAAARANLARSIAKLKQPAP